MKYKDLVKDASEILKKHGISDPIENARDIFLNLLDIDMAEYLYDAETELEDKFSKNAIMNLISEFDELINLRASHFPLQYIRGYEYFCGLKFNVNENVLIPRSDTETLVEAVLSDNSDKNKTVLDMCTGSGCIAISLANLGNYKLVIGSDISDEALAIAKKNAEEIVNDFDVDDELNQQIYFYKSDMFSKIRDLKDKIGVDKFDIITVNPPYIKTNVISSLEDEVKKYEPRLALDGDIDGLRYYKIIARDAKNYLTENGKIYLEIGFDQADEVTKLFIDSGYHLLSLLHDLNGNNRVLVFSINSELKNNF